MKQGSEEICENVEMVIVCFQVLPILQMEGEPGGEKIDVLSPELLQHPSDFLSVQAAGSGQAWPAPSWSSLHPTFAY